MDLRKSYLHTVLWSLLIGFLILPAQAVEKTYLSRPVILKFYPNPASHGDTIYLEGKNFVLSGGALRAQSAEEDRTPQEGTYVEFTTKYGVKRVQARVMINPPIQGAQVCSVTIPRTAISGPMKIITISRENGRPIGFMSEVVNLSIMDEPTIRKTPAGWSHGAASFLKEIPKKILKDAYYYQTERVAREAKQAFVRQETLRVLNSQYDINRASYFNSMPQIGYGQLIGETRGEEARIGQSDHPSFAAQFFRKPKSTSQMPFYTLGNTETMQKDIQEDLYNYAKPLFERLMHINLEPDPLPEKTGFTRPQVRLAYSVGLATNGSTVSHGGLARNMGFRIDFHYVRIDPLTEQMRRTMSFSLGADSRQTEFHSGREQRFLFLIRFR